MVLIGIKRQNDECTPPLQTVLYNIMTMCMSVITAKGWGRDVIWLKKAQFISL